MQTTVYRPSYKIEAQINILNKKLSVVDLRSSFGIKGKIAQLEKELKESKKFEFLSK